MPAATPVSTPFAGRRQQAVEARRQKILATAARLFRERGYHGVSVDEIGTTAGFTGPAIYKYFRDKEALLVAILDQWTSVAEAELDAIEAAGLPPRERLERNIRMHIDFAGNARDALVIAVRERPNIPDAFMAPFTRRQQKNRELAANALVALRPELSLAEARYICTNVFQGMISSAAYLYPADTPARKERLARMAMAALMA